MTRTRKKILEILETAETPLSALGVEAHTMSSCDTATVYRSLHYLEEQGLADSFVLFCREHGTERYYVANSAKHRHWFHCEVCHRFVDLGECRVEPLLSQMEAATGVRIRSHTLYATGTCADCLHAGQQAASRSHQEGEYPREGE